jgi:hypothetical protein
MTKKQEPLIHLRFDYSQAKEGKKDILSSEADLLKISKIITNYKKLRLEEFEKKEKIKSKIKILKSELTKLNKSLPKVVIPKILKKEKPIEKPESEENPSNEMPTYGTVEDQLREIQRKFYCIFFEVISKGPIS